MQKLQELLWGEGGVGGLLEELRWLAREKMK